MAFRRRSKSIKGEGRITLPKGSSLSKLLAYFSFDQYFDFFTSFWGIPGQFIGFFALGCSTSDALISCVSRAALSVYRY